MTLSSSRGQSTTTMSYYCGKISGYYYTWSMSGLLFSGLSGIFFTMSNFMVQVATSELSKYTTNKLSPLQMVIARCLVQLVFILPYAAVSKSKLYRNVRDLVFIVPMGFAGFINIIFIYLSLQLIPLSDTLLITFTSSFFCAVFSKCCLKEGIHWVNVMAGIVSFMGVVLVARPTSIFGSTETPRKTLIQGKHSWEHERIYLLGVFYALLGAIFLALYFVLIRKLIGKAESELHPVISIFYPSVFGSIFASLVALIQGDNLYLPRNFQDFVIMCSIGIYSTLAICFLTLALKMQDATVVNLIRNLDVVYAFLLQYAVFDIKPNKWNVSGGAVILTATSVVVLRQYYVSKITDSSKETQDNPQGKDSENDEDGESLLRNVK